VFLTASANADSRPLNCANALNARSVKVDMANAVWMCRCESSLTPELA
jgi:hypothetical protein